MGRKVGATIRPEQVGERGRGVDDFSVEGRRWPPLLVDLDPHRSGTRPFSEQACVWAECRWKRKHPVLVHQRKGEHMNASAYEEEVGRPGSP